MPESKQTYMAIDDWSSGGRARIAAEHEDEIRFLLEKSFAAFADDYPLAAFGFDSVEEAADFAFQRFAHGKLDRDRIRVHSRSFRLFTEPRFWLSQKTGPGYGPIMARIRRARDGGATKPNEEARSRPKEDDGLDLLREATVERWRSTLQELWRRTCRDIVLYWLIGTHRLRRDQFGWRDEGAGAPAAGSKAARSKHVYDAMSRFQILHRQYVPAPPPRDDAQIAVESSLFSPCENRSPYRAALATVSTLLSQHLDRPRAINRLWRDGLARLLQRLLDEIEGTTEDDNPFEIALTHISLGATTLHAYKLDDATLRRRVARLESQATKEMP